MFNRSYENLFQAGQVDTIREWAGGSYAMQNAAAVGPYQHGSHRSKLVDLLRKGHYDARLSREEWVRLVTWIDCGAPYYGSYFGRRNLQYQGQPDFRPVPTVESACGIRPAFAEPRKLPPIPARLLAHWPLDDADGDKVADASGGGHDARAVNLVRSEEEDRASRVFDGRGFLESGSLGAHEAVSIAMWVKPESWNANWNPLLFCDDIRTGTLHFSLLSDGTPNVAINTGGSNWTHRRASDAAGLNAWHHVILVVDARRGGGVQFYVDGQPAGRRYLGLDGRLDLYGFRIGAWNRWQANPANNFHGRLADVRIYSGTLTDQQAARLAEQTGAKPR
jgi:hypothetical protein